MPSNHQRGLDAEAAVADLYQRNGYTLLARRFKTRDGELDLVCQRDDVLVFVEVKRRSNALRAAEAVTPRQQQRWQAAALNYLAQQGVLDRECRFDAALVTPDGAISVLENVAF